MFLLILLCGLVAGQYGGTTSDQWLIVSNTSVFWPTSTNYFYGPTAGPNASAVLCNAAWVQYDGRERALTSLGATASYVTSTSWMETEGACVTSVRPEAWSDTHTGPLTTLCDGIPRALGPRELATRNWPGTGPCVSSYTTSFWDVSLYRTPTSVPDCTLHTQECIPIWETYSSRLSDYYETRPTFIPGDTNSPIQPDHCPSTTRTYPEANPCSNCHFLPGTATLFYWPVTTASGDLCLQNGTTLSPSGPRTAIVDGSTFVSPTVYLSFTTIYAWSNRAANRGHQCGVDHSDAVLALNPTDVSSFRSHLNARYPRIGTVYPFNFAEFMPQELGQYTQSVIPWPQYLGGSQCPLYEDTCTMVRDDYVPWVSMPKEVTQIDPLWTVCDRSWYIPPVTMVPLDQTEIHLTSTTSLTPSPTLTPAPARMANAVPQGGFVVPTPEATRGW